MNHKGWSSNWLEEGFKPKVSEHVCSTCLCCRAKTTECSNCEGTGSKHGETCGSCWGEMSFESCFGGCSGSGSVGRTRHR